MSSTFSFTAACAAVWAAGLALLGLPAIAAAQAQGALGQSVASPVAADSPPLGWQYGGFADVGYLGDFNHPSNRLFRSRGTAWHVDEWDLNMAGAYIKKKASDQSRWGAEFLVHAGKDDEVFGFSATAPNAPGSRWTRHLGLSNVSYAAPVGNGLRVQGGIFSSLIGYDSLYAKDNFNYTRPWGADFTPYLMMGVNVSYPFADKVTGTFFAVNGYWHLADANGVPSSGGQLAYRASSKVSVKETVLVGPHQPNTSLRFWRVLADTIVERRGEKGTVALEFQFSTERVDAVAGQRAYWMAAQLPLHRTLNGSWSVSLRPEVAVDSEGRWTLYEQTVKAVTATLEYRLPFRGSTVLVRIEDRVDDSRGNGGGFFKGGDMDRAVGLTPTQHLLIVALIVSFDSPLPR